MKCSYEGKESRHAQNTEDLDGETKDLEKKGWGVQSEIEQERQTERYTKRWRQTERYSYVREEIYILTGPAGWIYI